MSLLRRLVLSLVPHLSPPRVIFDRLGESPYLSRYYLTGRATMPDGSAPFDTNGNPKPGIQWPSGRYGLYLHRFHRSDEDGALHNHPWLWAVSLMLTGGYSEERRVDSIFGHLVERRLVLPGALNIITHDTYHRVDLIAEDAWTLFLVGPRISSWGFWERITGAFLPWRDHISNLRGKEWNES